MKTHQSSFFIVLLLGSFLRMGSSSSYPREEFLASNDTLFDLLETKGHNEGAHEAETFPPLSMVEHYAISWFALLSFTKYDNLRNDEEESLKKNDMPPNNDTATATTTSLDHLFWNPKSRFQLVLRLTCPKASRLVLGLVDGQGILRSSRNVSSSNNPDQNDSLSSSMSCGPLRDTMNRNVLECMGIPAVLIKHHQLAFDKTLEVTCLTYYDDTNNMTSNSGMVSKTLREQQHVYGDDDTSETNDNKDHALRLILSTPKQHIKTRTNLVLTESFYATKITNLMQYLNAFRPQTTTTSSYSDAPETLATYWDGEKSVFPTIGKTTNSFTDASSFHCRSNKGASSTTCPAQQQAQDSSPIDTNTAKPGLCTRQVTCYYSAPSRNGSCTSTIDQMVLASAVPDKANNNRQLQHDAAIVKNINTSNLDDVQGLVPAAHQDGTSKLGRRIKDKKRKLSTSMFYHEARYRLLWTAINIGCDSFPLRMDVTCTHAASITYHGGGSPNNTATTLECYQSLFRANTLHCRRTIPSVVLVGNSNTELPPRLLLSLDIQCTQLIHNETDALSTLIDVEVYETANIQCHPGQQQAAPDMTRRPDDFSTMMTFPLTPIAVVGSAITILPVTTSRRRSDGLLDSDNDSNSNGQQQNNDHFVTLPPPISGASSLDLAIRGTCPLCQDGNAFYVNYNNSIGNKVAQLASGCQVFASCHVDYGWQTWASSSEGGGNQNQAFRMASQVRGCINAIPSTTMSFQDDAQFAAWIRPAESSSATHHHMAPLLLPLTLSAWISLYLVTF